MVFTKVAFPFVPSGVEQFQPFLHLFQSDAGAAFVILILGVIAVAYDAIYLSVLFSQADVDKAVISRRDSMLECISISEMK